MKNRFALSTIGLAGLLAVLAGCAPQAAPVLELPPAEASPSASPPLAAPLPVNPTPETSPSPAAVDLARDDLAKRQSVPPDEIQLVTAERVDWPDSSLGCPQAGLAYAQVITPGLRIVLEAEGHRYEYHADDGRHLILCTVDGAIELLEIPIQPGERIQDAKPWMPVN